MINSMVDLRSGKALRVVFVGLLSLIAAIFAFAGALAGFGLPVGAFRAFGPSFFASDVIADRQAQRFLSANQQVPGQKNATAGVTAPSYEMLRQAALSELARASFDSLGPTVGSFALEVRGDKAGAMRMLDRSGRLSRRDSRARYWMMMRAMRAGDLDGMLRNLDIFLRSITDPPAEIFQQLVPLLAVPGGQDALEKLARSRPNWLIALYESLVTNAPQAARVAQLMIDSGYSFPDGAREREVYASLVRKLANQGAADELRRIYPRLPGADARLLSQVAPRSEGQQSDYAPVAWSLGDSSDVSGELLADDRRKGTAYLELSAAPGHQGVAASKIVFGHGGHSVVARAVRQTAGGGAHLVITCVNGTGAPIRSGDLMAQQQTAISLPLPSGCGAVRIDVEMIGGEGRDAAALDLKDIALR